MASLSNHQYLIFLEDPVSIDLNLILKLHYCMSKLNFVKTVIPFGFHSLFLGLLFFQSFFRFANDMTGH